MRTLTSALAAPAQPDRSGAKSRWLLVVCAALAGALLACDKPARPHPQGPGLDPQGADVRVENVPKVSSELKDSSLTPEQRALVVAKIGDRTITLGELEARLAQEPMVVRSQFASVQKRKEYLQKMVQFEVLAAEAKRRGLDQDPEVIEATKQAMIRKFLQEGIDTGAEVEGKSIPDADLKAYYDANPGLYHKPEQVEVSHMLLPTREKAEQVAGELRAGSEGNTAKLVALWNDYVVRLSEDKATAQYLGALGLVSKVPPPGASEAELQRLRELPPELVEAAFKLQPYEIGPVVQSKQGFHVLMVTSKSPAVEKSLDEVKESIRARIVKREKDLQRQKRLEQLRAQAKVEVNDDAVRLIQPPKLERAPKLSGAGADEHDHDHGHEPAPPPAPVTP